MAKEPGNVVTHYKDRELSKEAQEKIRAILAEERKKARMAKRVQVISQKILPAGQL